MKLFILLIFLASSISLIAKEEKVRAIKVFYEIISDSLSNDLDSGQVRVKGHVTQINGVPLESAMLATIDGSISTYTDVNGNYEMLIRDIDTSIYMYRSGYEEIAIAPYVFQSGHTVEINFTPRDEVVIRTPYDTGGSYETLKPVIYLYSTTSMQVSLALDYLGELTFTYPEYNEGWNVNVDANGITDPNNENSYPYLFWEGEMEGLGYETKKDKLIGELIATDTLVDYLEHQLSVIGLNRTEQTDFITFWAPRMIGKAYVFVQFLVDDLYTDNVAELTVNPQPESMKRVYLLYTELDEKPQMEYTPQVFVPFNREGFTLIEWGGSKLPTLTTDEL
jgi:hypothetical protein